MKIIKYEKKGNNQYKIYLEQNQNITIYEDVIIKNNLLYKKEIDKSLLEQIDTDNYKEKIYNKCIKYISVRIRSKYEIEEYLKRNQIDEQTSIIIIDKLQQNNLLNDEEFTKAFIHDKINFTTMGPYRIEKELQKHKIDSYIISTYLNQISPEIIDNKINKYIQKQSKATKKNQNIRNKIYLNLLNLGYSNEMILRNINNYNFNQHSSI